jgi:hypothetical protein
LTQQSPRRGFTHSQTSGNRRRGQAVLKPPLNKGVLADRNGGRTTRVWFGVKALDTVLGEQAFPAPLCGDGVAKSICDLCLGGELGLAEGDSNEFEE